MVSPALGYGLALVAGGLVIQGRCWYLTRASRGVCLDGCSTCELKPATWAYVIPALAVVYGLCFLSSIHAERGGELLNGTLGVISLLAGIWWFRNMLQSRVVIAGDKLVFTEGREHRELLAEDVLTVGIYWFSFRVRLRWDRTVFLPTTFRSSEVILAFLQASASKNRDRSANQ